jgi:hypothetical protein
VFLVISVVNFDLRVITGAAAMQRPDPVGTWLLGRLDKDLEDMVQTCSVNIELQKTQRLHGSMSCGMINL